MDAFKDAEGKIPNPTPKTLCKRQHVPGLGSSSQACKCKVLHRLASVSTPSSLSFKYHIPGVKSRCWDSEARERLNMEPCARTRMYLLNL